MTHSRSWHAVSFSSPISFIRTGLYRTFRFLCFRHANLCLKALCAHCQTSKLQQPFKTYTILNQQWHHILCDTCWMLPIHFRGGLFFDDETCTPKMHSQLKLVMCLKLMSLRMHRLLRKHFWPLPLSALARNITKSYFARSCPLRLCLLISRQ